MFGGRAWLLNGNLLCGARDDGMLARLGKGGDAWALALQDVVPMISRGRAMKGWVRAGPMAFGDDALRRRLIAAALGFVQSLPASRRGDICCPRVAGCGPARPANPVPVHQAHTRRP